MTKKYKYKYEVEEYSQDARHFVVESDVKLNENEINDCISNVSIDKPYTYKGSNFTVSFTGTELGDDCQVNISEVE